MTYSSPRGQKNREIVIRGKWIPKNGQLLQILFGIFMNYISWKGETILYSSILSALDIEKQIFFLNAKKTESRVQIKKKSDFFFFTEEVAAIGGEAVDLGGHGGGSQWCMGHSGVGPEWPQSYLQGPRGSPGVILTPCLRDNSIVN